MAIISTFVDGMTTAAKLDNDVIQIQNVLDFSKVNVAASSVVEALKVPANCFVRDVATYVITVEDSTSTFDLGDGDDPNGYNDTVNSETLGGAVSISGTDDLANGKFYSAADTIDLTFSAHAVDTLKILVRATVCNLQADLA